MSRFLVYVLLSVFGPYKSLTAQSNTNRLEEYFINCIDRYNLPGIAFVVIKNSSIVTSGAYGYADIDKKLKATTNTIYPIASMDKQLIGTCIMILYERGSLKLEDPVTKFFPDAPPSWSNILVKHLLSHTSGIPNKMPHIKKKPIPNDALFSFIKRQKMAFYPGDDWLYTDAGFVLLQLIVEKISGQTFDDFQNENILKPLEMNNTQLLTPQVTRDRALYYDRKKNGRVKENKIRLRDRGPLYNDLGSTINDFVKWDIAITENKLITKSTRDIMWSPFILNNGLAVTNLDNTNQLFDADRSYGFAWLIKHYNNHRIIYHSGYTGTSIMRFPDDNLTVVVFSNLVDPGGFNPDIIARRIAEFYLPGCSPYINSPNLDPHPEASQLIQKQIEGLQHEVINVEMFTEEFQKKMERALPPFKELLKKNFGPLKSSEYVMHYSENGRQRLVYKVNYSNGILYYQVVLNDENKIQFMTVER